MMKQKPEQNDQIREQVLKELLKKSSLYYQQEIDGQELAELNKQINGDEHDS